MLEADTAVGPRERKPRKREGGERMSNRQDAVFEELRSGTTTSATAVRRQPRRVNAIKGADLREERGLAPVDLLVRESSAPPSSVPPKVLEPVGRQFGVPDGVLDVLVA